MDGRRRGEMSRSKKAEHSMSRVVVRSRTWKLEARGSDQAYVRRPQNDAQRRDFAQPYSDAAEADEGTLSGLEALAMTDDVYASSMRPEHVLVDKNDWGDGDGTAP